MMPSVGSQRLRRAERGLPFAFGNDLFVRGAIVKVIEGVKDIR